MDKLSGLLGSEARARIVVHFAVCPDSRLHTRALARHVGIVGKRSLQIEVDRLVELGLLRREAEGRHTIVCRNQQHPQWAALTSLVQAYAPALVLRDALASVPGVEAAFIFGSFARRDERPDSDIDLLIYGDSLPDGELGRALLDAALVLDRVVDTKRYDRQSFQRDIRPGASFLPNALAGPKVWLAGSPGDLPTRAEATA
jgi:predicted nucleotidyltransferase